MGMSERVEVKEQAKKRMESLSFGDPVTNVCAGNGNPMRHCYFVEYVIKKYTNKYRVTHSDHLAKCTDRKGNFGNFGIEVIFPGHLAYEESTKIFDPIHKALFA